MHVHTEVHEPIIKLALRHDGIRRGLFVAPLRQRAFGSHVLRAVVPIAAVLNFFLAPRNFGGALLSFLRLRELIDKALAVRVLALGQPHVIRRVAQLTAQRETRRLRSRAPHLLHLQLDFKLGEFILAYEYIIPDQKLELSVVSFNQFAGLDTLDQFVGPRGLLDPRMVAMPKMNLLLVIVGPPQAQHLREWVSGIASRAHLS